MMRHGALKTSQNSFTSTIQAEVAWKHDPTAHNVPLEAARSKRVAHPATMEQLAVVYNKQPISAAVHMSVTQ